MGWGDPGPKPAADAKVERLQPLELPLRNMAQWKKDHPWYRFFHSPSGGEAVGKAAVTIGLEVLGHSVKVLSPIGWLHFAYEVLESAGHDDEARHAQLLAWNAHMSGTFWDNESAYPAAGLREAEFDRLAGDNRSHGITPILTEQAEFDKQQLIAEINGRWLANAETMLEAKQYLERHGAEAEASKAWWQAEAAEARRNAELYVLMDPARSERERWRAEFFADGIKSATNYVEPSKAWVNAYNADVKAVLAIETNPANWDLTPEQKGMLNDRTSPGTSAPPR